MTQRKENLLAQLNDGDKYVASAGGEGSASMAEMNTDTIRRIFIAASEAAREVYGENNAPTQEFLEVMGTNMTMMEDDQEGVQQ